MASRAAEDEEEEGEEEDQAEAEEEAEAEAEDEALLGGAGDGDGGGGGGDGDVHGGAYLRVNPLQHPAVSVQLPLSLRPARRNPCGTACSPVVQSATRCYSLQPDVTR